MNRIVFAVAFAVGCAAYLNADPVPPPSVTLLPSANVGGQPGSAVGWGFDLTDTSPDYYYVLTGSEFTGNPDYGTYQDYLRLPTAPLYLVGPPGPSPTEPTTIQQNWDQSSQLGVGEFDLFASDSVGQQISGELIIHYSVFSGDPTTDPNAINVVPDATLPIAVDVTATPEPATFGLAGAAIAAAWVVLRRRRAA